MSLLEDKVVELNIVARASDNTIARTLKNRLKPHLIPAALIDDSSIDKCGWYRAPGWPVAARKTKTHADRC